MDFLFQRRAVYNILRKITIPVVRYMQYQTDRNLQTLIIYFLLLRTNEVDILSYILDELLKIKIDNAFSIFGRVKKMVR